MDGAELSQKMVQMHQEMLENFAELKQDNLEIRRGLKELEEKLEGTYSAQKSAHGATMDDAVGKVGDPGEAKEAGGEGKRGSMVEMGESKEQAPKNTTSADKENLAKKTKRRVAKEFRDETIRQDSVSAENIEAG